MTLAEFLLQRIAEDEAVALESVGGDPSGWIKDEKLTDDCGLHPDTSAHIIRWSPARVLVECEAKRRIVAECLEADEGTSGDVVAHRVLRLLALPYADHPNYQPDWRPRPVNAE